MLIHTILAVVNLFFCVYWVSIHNYPLAILNGGTFLYMILNK